MNALELKLKEAGGYYAYGNALCIASKILCDDDTVAWYF